MSFKELYPKTDAAVELLRTKVADAKAVIAVAEAALVAADAEKKAADQPASPPFNINITSVVNKGLADWMEALRLDSKKTGVLEIGDYKLTLSKVEKR